MQKLINLTGNSYLTNKAPNHLIIIQHGWLAPWIRATPLGKGLYKFALNNNNNNQYLIHIIRSNSDDYLFGWIKTNDGINNGGQRTGNEIKLILDKYQSIKKISVIGQSLGGLYIRFAIKELYDENKSTFYNNVEPVNFVSLGSPHLGTDDWCRLAMNGSLFKIAKYFQKFGFLPNTLQQLLRLDDDRLLNQMANNKEYLLPLSQFKSRMIYANAINDNRVSASSGLLLPSFNYKNEQKLIQNLFIKHINESKTDKRSIVKDINDFNIKNMNINDGNDLNDNEWYHGLSESMEWKRFIVSMDSNSFVNRKMTHGLLSNPIPSYASCQPVLEHLNQQFQW